MPTGVAAPVEIVSTDEPEPGAAIDDGAKLAEAPDGNPDAESKIEELKAPLSVDVIVEVPAAAWPIVKDCGEADSENPGSAENTGRPPEQ